MFNDKLSFLPNNGKGIKASEKRLKSFEHFRNLNTPSGFVFLQETHSSVDITTIFKHGKTNSCGLAIDYYGKKSFELLNKFNDKSGRVLIIEVKIENEVLSLINLYNANTENEQLSTLSDLSNILEKIDNIKLN